MSLSVKLILGFLCANTPLVPTKNLPVAGSLPAIMAGAPSHLVVMLTGDFVLPSNISYKLYK